MAGYPKPLDMTPFQYYCCQWGKLVEAFAHYTLEKTKYHMICIIQSVSGILLYPLNLMQLVDNFIEDRPPELCKLYPLQTSKKEGARIQNTNTAMEDETDDIIASNEDVQKVMLKFSKIHQCHNNVICAALRDDYRSPTAGALLGIMRKEWGIEDARDVFEDDVPPAVVS